MRIPSDILTPYLTEITSQPSANNRTAEPVGESASIDNALPQSPRNEQSVSNQDRSEIRNEKRERQKSKLAEYRADKERRQEDRRKGKQPVLLDTRISRSRRKPAGYAAVNFKI